MRHWDSLTDAQRLWVLLRRAGSEGVHSHDLRSQGISGNPSQRAKDVTSKGQQVFTSRESRKGRPGSRYWLQAFAPPFSVAVNPNFGSPSPSEPSGGDSIGRSLEDAVLEASAGRSEISLEDFEQTTLAEAVA